MSSTVWVQENWSSQIAGNDVSGEALWESSSGFSQIIKQRNSKFSSYCILKWNSPPSNKTKQNIHAQRNLYTAMVSKIGKKKKSINEWEKEMKYIHMMYLAMKINGTC